jgi:cellulose synthase/poly-beta-1,6-N-acetylglucosamine synthase-like glycosyltransferase
MLIPLLTLILVLVGFGLAYLYFLLAAGGKHTRQQEPPSSWPRLAIALPAHNEEAVIGASVRRLLQCDYPPECFDVHVVADYCTDGTAVTAAAAGALAHRRETGPRGRKGYALGWLFQHLLADPKMYDAIIVFDADSQVDAQFLTQAIITLNSGAQVVQGRHVISNPSTSIFSALADADMRLNNRIRNQAKTNLGLSARLMGDAMCFHRHVLETHPWSQANSLTEDREYGIYLATQGVRVVFASNAVSAGQATARWKDATSQRLRWYGGVFELQKRYLLQLIIVAFRRANATALDLALELLLPSFSTLTILAVIAALATGALVAFGLAPWGMFGAAVGLTLFAVAFPFIGLATEGAPASTYRALLYGPAYVLWRFWIGVKATSRRGNVQWVRTRRAEEETQSK